MSKRQSYVIQGETFATKSALQDRIKYILYHWPHGGRLPVGDFDFMMEVLAMHPDAEQKIGVGVDRMEVRRNPVYTNTRGFWVIRTDGSETDFSYLECLKETPHAKRFLNACRVAIEPETMAFKNKFFGELHGEVARCPYTGEVLSFVGSHVDHKAPATFQALVDGFIAANHIDVSLVKINGKAVDGNFQDTFDDPALLRNWLEYHSGHAVLQVVSRTANLSILRRGGK